MITKDIEKLIEKDAKIKSDDLGKKIQKLLDESGLQGIHRKIYEAGIEEGLRLGVEMTKSVLETLARLKEMEEDVKTTKCS